MSTPNNNPAGLIKRFHRLDGNVEIKMRVFRPCTNPNDGKECGKLGLFCKVIEVGVDSNVRLTQERKVLEWSVIARILKVKTVPT